MAAPDARLLRGVRLRLVAWSALTTLVVLGVLGVAFYTVVAQAVERGSIAQLEARLDQLTAGRRALTRALTGPLGVQVGGPGSGTFAVLVGPEDDVILGSEAIGLPVSDGVTAARSGGEDIRTARVSGAPIRVLSVQVTVPRLGPAVLQIAQDITPERQTLDTLVVVLVLGGGLALLAATLAGTAYASRALVPIRESLRRQREFAADASHELRTPLAVIRASVDDLERQPDTPVRHAGPALGDIRAEVDHVTALVDDLLLLARSDSGAIALEQAPLDLAGVAEESIASLNPLAERRAARIVLDPTPTPIVGDQVRLRQLVTILVDNAIRHSPPFGRVTVSLRTDASRAVLTVDDDGPGIRPEDLANVFDRFWRADGEPAGGTGLGLAIAAWIARQHGGTIEVQNRTERGARFTVRLPLRA
ncbi:MAG TPA: HAMP domain-containing sensor histidine kinase [Candidatus Limnocylindrales bacterium]|nr:HAMP domain-containing sensor histidine kinase [Candidatus Limnocylindrales bacterium]